LIVDCCKTFSLKFFVIFSYSELQTEPLTKDIGHDDTETGEYSNILNVYIARSPGQSLGISIVGGNEEALSKGIIGIFVRTIVEDSPAGCENGLKVNDRILEVRNLCFLKKPQVFLLFIFGQLSFHPGSSSVH
jgi:hypothetical protein